MFMSKVTVQETKNGQKFITIPVVMAEVMNIEKGDTIMMSSLKKGTTYKSEVVKKED